MRCTVLMLLLGLGPQAALAQSIEPYVPDPGFNGGVTIEDRFAGAATDNFIPQKIVRLASGEVVVAGLVPASFQRNQSGGLFNVGLVRYGVNGERVPWANPSAGFVHFQNRYVVVNNSNTQRFTDVRDLRAANGSIYVLADWQGSPGSGGDVHILTFGEDGAFKGTVVPFGTGLPEYGAGLVLNTYTLFVGGLPRHVRRLYAVASYVNGSLRTVPTLRAYARDPDGLLAVDNGFGTNGNGAMDYPAPNSGCDAGSNCSATAKAVAATRLGTENPTLYIASDVIRGGGDVELMVTAVNGVSGSLHGSFNGGHAIRGFNVGGSNADHVRALAVEAGGSRPDLDIDRIYVAASIAQNCKRGTGLLVLDQTGQLAPFANFGIRGTVEFGGSNAAPCPIGGADDDPNAMALLPGRIAIAGAHAYFHPLLRLANTDPFLAVLKNTSDTQTNGDRTEFDVFPATRANGMPWGDAVYSAMAVGEDGRITLTGAMFDSDYVAPEPSLFGTTRLMLDPSQRPSEIFSNGFEHPCPCA